MDSLVSYVSDDEGSDIYQDNKDPIQREMDRLGGRQTDEDTNYDNVQMDMSEESNNNHSPDGSLGSDSSSGSDDDKSSVKSSLSSRSMSSHASSNEEKPKPVEEKKSNAMLIPSLGEKQFIAGRSDNSRSEKDRKEKSKDRHDTKERNRRDDKSKERSRRDDRPGKDRRRNRHSRSNSRDRDRRSALSGKDRKRRTSRSPVSRHGSSSGSGGSKPSDSSSSRYSRSSREKDKDREKDRQRSRSRDRGRSRDRSRERSKERNRRRGYEKKPNKLTILERLGIELRPPEAPPAVTPQQLLQRSIELQVQQVKSNTGIELPKYYNPAAMNPARYAEQMQKRRLLWGNKAVPQPMAKPEVAAQVIPPPQTSNNKWEGTTFAQDQDGKMTAKFKRLMGIKGSGQGSSTGAATDSQANPESNELLKKQEELFNSMEMQYEVARVATHTHRGLGLGFGTFQYPR